MISPCVTFNDHEGSTKSYEYTRDHYHPAIHADFVPPSKEIKAEYDEGQAMPITLHDGGQIVLRKIDSAYDPTDRAMANRYLEERQSAGEIVTGLLFIDEVFQDMHDINNTSDIPLSSIDFEKLCPGQAGLKKLQNTYR